MSEIFVAPQALVVVVVVVEELILRIGVTAKQTCFRDTRIHGRFHGSLGPPHFGGQVLRHHVWVFEEYLRTRIISL